MAVSDNVIRFTILFGTFHSLVFSLTKIMYSRMLKLIEPFDPIKVIPNYCQTDPRCPTILPL